MNFQASCIKAQFAKKKVLFCEAQTYYVFFVIAFIDCKFKNTGLLNVILTFC